MDWYSDENMVRDRIRDMEREADRIQALGPRRRVKGGGWKRARMTLGRALVVLGKRLQGAGTEELVCSSRCTVR
jgi:hypothetical protein